MRTLDSRNVTVLEELRIVEHDDYRRLWRGKKLLADDSADTHARVARFALAAAPLRNKAVAWIGGGLGVGPSLFDIAGCTQTVYEIEPALAEFCPQGVTFVPGDWHETFTGKYDIIIYDLGGAAPAKLTEHLNEGGILLPKEPQ